MKDYNADIFKLGMEDEDDYDEYEEEIIERDEYDDAEDAEYYDEGDEYYDENGEYYDENGEYYDENGEYYDENGEYYDEEQPYEEEPYEEPYDEYYEPEPYNDGAAAQYDDRLSQVLDELAALKRSVGNNSMNSTPAVISHAYSTPTIPQQPYFITPPLSTSGGNNDITMYNEISRLRDELSKTQSEQTMRNELDRLKEKMDKDQQSKEAGFLSEIRRLNEKIESLNKPAPKEELTSKSNSVVGGVSVCSAERLREDFTHLIEINEAILRSVKDTDSKTQAQISDMRKKLGSLPNFDEIGEAVNSLRENIKSIPKPQAQKPIDTQSIIKEISEVVANHAATASPAPVAVDSSSKLKDIKAAVNAIHLDDSEVLRQIYDLKTLIGSSSGQTSKRNAAVLELYNGFNKLKYDLDFSTLSLAEKMESIDSFAKELAQSNETEANDLYQSLIKVIDKILSVSLTKSVADGLNSFADKTGAVKIHTSKRDAVIRYIAMSDKIAHNTALDALEILPELLDTINVIQENKSMDANNVIYSEIMDLSNELAYNPENILIESQIKSKIVDMCNLKAYDYVTYTPIKLAKTHKPNKTADDIGLFDKINELKTIIADLNVVSSGGTGGEASASNSIVLGEIKNLKTELAALVENEEINSSISTLKLNTSEIIQKLDEMMLSNIAASSNEASDPSLLEDIIFIRDSVERQEAFVSQIADLRNEIYEITNKSNSDGHETHAAVGFAEELAAQLDKLYEDLIASTTEANAISLKQMDEINLGIGDILVGYDKISNDLDEIRAQLGQVQKSDEQAETRQSIQESEKILQQIENIKEQFIASGDITKEQTDILNNQVSLLLDEISSLKQEVTKEMDFSEATINEETTLLTLNEINDKLQNMLFGVGGDEIDNIQILLADINDIKEKVFAETSMTVDVEKLAEDIATLRTEIENLGSSIKHEEFGVIIEDLGVIKDKLFEAKDTENEGGNDAISEILNLKEEINAHNLLEQNEILSELETLHSDILSFKESLNQISELKSEISKYRTVTVSSENTLTDGEMSLVLSEVVALRDEVQSYKDDLIGLYDLQQTKTENKEVAPDSSNEDNFNILFDEISSLRAEVLGYNEESQNFQAGISELKQTVEQINDTVTRQITESFENESKAADISVILEEISYLKESMDGIREEIEILKSDRQSELENDVLSIKDMLQRLLEERDSSADNAVYEAQSAIMDEIGSLREQITSMNTTQSDSEVVQNAEVLDELSAMTNDISAIGDDIIALREQVAAISDANSNAEDDTTDSAVLNAIEELREQIVGLSLEISEIQQSASEESSPITLSEIMDEITMLKEQVAQFTTPEAITIDNSVVLDELSDIRDQIANVATYQASMDSSEASYSDMQEELNEIKEQLVTITSYQLSTVENPDNSYENLLNELSEIKEQLANMPTSAVATSEGTIDLSGVYSELSEIKEQLANMPASASSEIASESVTILFDEINGLREQISAFSENENSTDGEENAILQDIVNQISELKEQIAENNMHSQQNEESSNMLNILFDEINSMKEQLDALSAADSASNSTGYDVMVDEIQALKSKLEENTSTEGVLNELTILQEEIIHLKNDLRKISDEPDLSIINEILALRDEFQDFKDEINSSKRDVERVDTKSNEDVLNQVQLLRDQLFAISMANINDGTSAENTYESYNNIILDEIASVREEIHAIKASDSTHHVMGEIEDLRQTIVKSTDTTKIFEQIAKLRADIDILKDKKAESIEKANEKALVKELTTIKSEVAKQRAAEASNYKHLSDMAKIQEQQNQFIKELAKELSNVKTNSELESAKKELSYATANSQILDEIAQIKSRLAATYGENVEIDNKMVLTELESLTNELQNEYSQNPNEQNRQVLDEVSRLKREVTFIVDSETPKDLSTSLSDLKSELEELANLNKPAKTTSKRSTGTRKKSSKSKSTTKSRAKSASTAKKAPAKKKDLSADELIDKINLESGDMSSGFMAVDTNADSAKSVEDDVAARMAKQVANKLIMEQLVQQLSDGGVPKSKVEEIVKDILPQEFNTIQMDEQSDQVRRLANSMVLDKLRTRLTGKK